MMTYSKEPNVKNNKIIKTWNDFLIFSAETAMKGKSPMSEEWAAFLFQKACAQANEAIKLEYAKRIDYYKGRQTERLKGLFRTQYKDYEQLILQLQFMNITKQVIDKISIVYSGTVKRELVKDGDGEVAEDQVKLWDFIQRKMKYDNVMRTNNCYVNLLGTTLIRPYISKASNCLKLDIMTPDLFDVVPILDDPTEAMAVIYARRNDDDYLMGFDIFARAYQYFYYWDKDIFRIFTIDGNILSMTGNEENENPYGILPFQKFTNEVETEGFYIDGGYELINAQENINIKLTELNTLIRMQCFSQPVIKGNFGKGAIVLSPTKPLVIPLGQADETPPDFSFVTPSPNITSILDEIKAEVERIAQTYGLSMNDFKLEGSPSSGVALKLQNKHLDDRRQLEKSFYEANESELFEKIKAVWNYECQFIEDSPFKNKTFDDTTHLKVEIGEPVYDEDPQQLRDSLEWELEKGLITPVMMAMKLYNLTEQEAIDQIEKVKQYNIDNPKEPTGFGMDTTPTAIDLKNKGAQIRDEEQAKSTKSK